MTTYRKDPRWIVTKHPGIDSNGIRYHANTKALYCPFNGRMFVGSKAERLAEELNVMTPKESVYSCEVS